MKKQLFAQRCAVIVMLATLTIAFAFSLGIATNLYDPLWTFANSKGNPANDIVPGASIYYDIQPFNKLLVNVTLVGILICLSLFFTNTLVRRKYYLSNYLTSGVTSIYSIAISFWAIFGVNSYKIQYLTTVDFDILEQECAIRGLTYSTSTVYFDLCMWAFVFVIVASLLLVANSIWKFLLLRKEKQLLNMTPANKEVAVQ